MDAYRIAELLDDVARLREALQRIADADHEGPGQEHCDCAEKIARKELEVK